MTIKQIIEKINKDYRYTGEYHTIECDDIVEVLECLKEDAEVATIDELMDKVIEELWQVADGKCPVHNYDIAKFFGENWRAFEEAMEEGMIDQNFINAQGVMKAIQVSWCMSYERDVVEAIRVALEDVFTDENN